MSVRNRNGSNASVVGGKRRNRNRTQGGKRRNRTQGGKRRNRRQTVGGRRNRRTRRN